MAKSKTKKALALFFEWNKKFFQYTLIIYLILLLIEIIWEGSVYFFLNINNMLIFILISGIMTVIFQKNIIENKKENEKIDIYYYTLILLLSIIGAIVANYKINLIGNISVIFSIIIGLFIFLLSILILKKV